MLYWIVINKKGINIWLVFVSCAIISISTWMGNDYWTSKFHWIVAVTTLWIMWLINFCIIQEAVIANHEEKEKEKKSGERPAHRPNDNNK